MKYDLLFRHTQYGDVAVSGGRIVKVGEMLAPAVTEIDAAGKWLLPGGVDVHTHLNLTVGGNRTCDGWERGSRAALAGGTTTVVEHIGFDAGGSCRAAFQQAFVEAEGRSCCDYSLHGVAQRVDQELLQALAEGAAEGLCSWKAYTTYDSPVYGEALERLFRAAQAAGVVVCVHCEDDGLLQNARAQLAAAGRLGPEYHPESRREVLAAALRAGEAPVHLVHLSTAAGLRELREARRRGQSNITAETCPQYLLLDSGLYKQGRAQALRAAMSPPLRSAEDRQALWQGLQRGDVDMVATDHCAFSLAQKEQGREDLRRTPNGAPGVEERLTLLLSEGVSEGRLTLERAVEVLCTAPARRFGLDAKGCIAPGFDADLVLFDPAGVTRYSSPPAHGGAEYSLYGGLELRGRVERVWLRGVPVYEQGRVLARPGQGRYVERFLRRSK